jgi:hypothetical protein
MWQARLSPSLDPPIWPDIMSKKYKGKTCVYCAVNQSETADHVFAREFFAIARRDNLPQVPACLKCNGQKSALEHYLTAILLAGGRHPDGEAMMFERLPRKLEKNQKLHKYIAEGLRLTVIDDPPPREGLIPVQVPFDGAQLLSLLRYVAKGLLWHHWKVILQPDHNVWSASLTRSGEALLTDLLNRHARQHSGSIDLGNGTFCYEGIQGDYPEFSLWRFSVYGGIRLHSQSPFTSSASTCLTAFTGRPDILADPDFVKLLPAS